jgi:predicted transcriptional regulator
MGKVVWKLEEALEELEISPNRLSVEAQVRPNTVYNMIYKKTTRFHLETAEKVLDALNSIAKEEKIHRKFTITDLLDYET